MFGAQKSGSKKKNLSMFDAKILKTEDDYFMFDDLPCDVQHLLHEMGQRNAINIELLLSKINNHIRQSNTFHKKEVDPTKFETDLKMFKEWFNQKDQQSKDKYQFYYGKDCDQKVDNYMNFNKKCNDDAVKVFWSKITEMITGPEHEALYLRKIIQKIQEFRQLQLSKRRKLKDNQKQKLSGTMQLLG